MFRFRVARCCLVCGPTKKTSKKNSLEYLEKLTRVEMRWMKHARLHAGIDSDPRFRCCGCCHVRTGTLCLGIYNMVVQAIAVFVLLFAVTHPEVLFDTLNNSFGSGEARKELDDRTNDVAMTKIEQPFDRSRQETLPELPTPQPHVLSTNEGSVESKVFCTKSDVLNFTRKRVQSGDVHLALALVCGLFSITAMLVYGCLKGRPIYLLPFFCFQVFDFILACLTAVGHYTWLPNLQELIAENPDIPFREQLLQMNGQWMALCILTIYVLFLIAKAYFIGVVWACYQYLHLRQSSILTYRTTEDGCQRNDAELLLPPDYEQAVKMPPAYVGGTPPPPYPAAVY